MIAYFCAEYALTADIHSYAGGLGILAGDLIKEAGEQDFPLVGIGLYYQEGYVQGNEEHWNRSRISPKEAGLSLVLDPNEQTLLIPIPIQDKIVFARAWQWKEKNVSLYLLDTNIGENDFNSREITNKLYIKDKEIRIKQEMVLGIGGYRLLKLLGVSPLIYHLNEGHPAFAIFEIIKNEIENRKAEFSAACGIAKQKIVYTNHTLVSGGHYTFDSNLVTTMIGKYASEFPSSISEIISLGLIPSSNLFSPTMLCLRLAGKMNTVSELHNQEAKKIWPDHQIETVTNGIFIPRWDKIKSNDPKKFWAIHQENKKKLLKLIYDKSGEAWEEDHLLIGWARRIVPYKRPMAILENLDIIKKLAQDPKRPIKFVFAGISHEGDEEGQRILNQLQLVIRNELKGIAVFLKNYNLQMTEFLTTGCDIWLNTPIVKSEACGTSGMKATLNCVLPLTTKDGWVDETKLQEIGWIAKDPDLFLNLIKLLENEIIPTYSEHLKNPVGSNWEKRMIKAREMITNNFSTKRVLKEYLEKMYQPLLETSCQ